MLFDYSDLSPIPQELIITDIEEIKKIPNHFGGKGNYYSIHSANPELEEYVQSLFDYPVVVRYQIIKEGVSIHVDRGRTECFNYIINSGGPAVRTVWYADDKETIIAEHVFPEHTWHRLSVDTFHGVSDIETIRFSITVNRKNED